MTDKVAKPNPVYNRIKNCVLKNENNFMIAVVGPTGVGKSFCALKLANDLDPGFDSSRIVFSAVDFYKIINLRAANKIPKGSCIVFDEAAIDMSNDLHYTNESVVHMKKVLQTFRMHRLICIFTFPVSLGFLNKSVRPMFDLTLDGRGINKREKYSTFVPHWNQTNTFSGKVYRHSPTGVNEDGREFIVSHMKIRLPPESLLKEYDKVKTRFANKIIREAKAFEQRKVEKDSKKLFGSKVYYDKIMEDPKSYLNKSGTGFNTYLIQFRLGVGQPVARGLAAALNNDWERGKIVVKES